MNIFTRIGELLKVLLTELFAQTQAADVGQIQRYGYFLVVLLAVRRFLVSGL
jgi:hypothetical protein